MDETVSGAAEPVQGASAFDSYYFANCCGRPYRRDAHWLGVFGAIADRIAADIQPRRVLDAGCALGILVETLRARSIDAVGVDISEYAIEHVFSSMRPYCRLGSITDEFEGRYDLIVSIEVLEHLPAVDGERAIANICRHTDDVLFSSSPSDHREPSHVNVQPVDYWAEQFARHGFHRDVDFDASFLTPWAVRFRRRADPVPRLVRDYERRYVTLADASLGARAFAVEVQRDLALAQQRIAALEKERDTLRQTIEFEHAASAAQALQMEQTLRHLSDLAVALDNQRKALLDSRLAMDIERNAATAARQSLEREQVTVAREREGLALERAAVAAEQAAFAAERETIDRERLALDVERDALDRQGAALARAIGHDREVFEVDEGRAFVALRSSIEETHAHLTRKVLALDAAEQEMGELRGRVVQLDHDLRHSRETVAHMERSIFWRMRRYWAAASRAIGRPT